MTNTLGDPFAGFAKFSLSADDAGAIVASLIAGGLSQSSGIFFEDGMLYAPATLTAQVTAAVSNIAAARKQALISYTASVRYQKETGGITFNGSPIDTDRESQSMITGAVVKATIDNTFSTTWKASDGSFVTLNATSIIALGNAVAAHVAACFADEAALVAQINAGTVTTQAAIASALNWAG